MPKIKFNYLYRDSANYKKFGYVVFADPDNMGIAELDALISSRLIDETFFTAMNGSYPTYSPIPSPLLLTQPGMSLKAWNIPMSLQPDQ